MRRRRRRLCCSECAAYRFGWLRRRWWHSRAAGAWLTASDRLRGAGHPTLRRQPGSAVTGRLSRPERVA